MNIKSIQALTSMAITLCKKYGLLDIVLRCTTTGAYAEMSKWKKLVDDSVTNTYMKMWKVTCVLYKSLQYVIQSIHIHVYHNIIYHSLKIETDDTKKDRKESLKLLSCGPYVTCFCIVPTIESLSVVHFVIQGKNVGLR